MANPLENVETTNEAKLESKQADSQIASNYDPLKLLSEAGSVLKDYGSKAVEAMGLSSVLDKSLLKAPAQEGAKPGELKDSTGQDAIKGQEKGKSERSILKAKDGKDTTISPKESTPAPMPGQKQVTEKQDKSQDKSKTTTIPSELPKEIADKVIDRIKDTDNPVEEIKQALKKLDNLKEASVTMNGRSSHIEISLLKGETSAPPDIQVRGFRPVASHLAPKIRFDATPHKNGLLIQNIDGISSSVRGPLGRIRHSETTSMFLGKDQDGRAYVNTSSDLHMRRRVHSSTTTMREENFPKESPMRALMQHPEALDKVSSMMRMFQSTSDLNKMGIKRNGENFDVKSEAKSGSHVELNFKPDGVPLTVKSLDLDKTLSASLKQEKDAVGLENISGLKVNVEIGQLKASVIPTKVSIEKDKVKMELKNPEDGSIVPFEIPIAKLKEAAKKRS